MSVKSKWAFKRLVDELSQEQYERMIAVLRDSDVPMPGWTDRLAPDPTGSLPAEAVRAHTPLEELTGAIALARTASRADYYNDPKGGVWLQASASWLRVCGSDDYAAAFMDLDASVDVPGTVVVDARDLQQITEALRKGTPRAAHGHPTDARNRGRQTPPTRRRRALPPRQAPPPAGKYPTSTTNRRNVDHRRRRCSIPARGPGRSPFCGLRRQPRNHADRLDHVGLRSTDGVLTIDAGHPYQAAQANLPVEPKARIERLVHYLWLRKITVALGSGPVQIGHVPEAGGHGVLVVAGDRWAAWTSHNRPWRQRFVPIAIPDVTTATFHRDDVYRHIAEAKRLAESSWAGKNSTLVRLTVSDDSLSLSSIADPESARTGSMRVPAQTTRSGAVTHAHLRISTLLDALQGFAKQDVSLHFGEGTIVYATTAGHLPDGHPPRLVTIPAATPAQTQP